LTLLWAQWVSIYQASATFKLVRMLEQVERDRGPRDLNLAACFAHGGGRRFLYASLNGLSTIYLVTASVLVYSFSGDYITGTAKALLLGGTLAATAGVFVVGFCAMRKAVYHIAGPFAKFKAWT
jgi:hypothetical protein